MKYYMITFFLLRYSSLSPAFQIISTNISVVKYRTNESRIQQIPEFLIRFADASWNLKIYRYNNVQVKQFSNIVLNNERFILKSNSYGIVKSGPDQTLLGYFNFIGGLQIEGMVEIDSEIYIFINLDEKNTLLVAKRNENFQHTSKDRKIFRQSIRSGLMASPSRCFTKLIIGPEMYRDISGKYSYKTVRRKLKDIKNYVNELFNNVNIIYSKLPGSLNVEFLVKELYILTPNVCKNEYGDSVWTIFTKSLCQFNATSDSILDDLESMYLNNVNCLTAVIISHEFIASTLGYANMASMCKFLYNKRIFFINVYGDRFIFNPKRSSLLMAHEIAHTFNAIHDDDTYCRTNGSFNFIMKSVFSKIIPIFSNCSIADMVAYMSKYRKEECFRDRSLTQVCGNGILETGEQCDCGSKTACKCCIRMTCRLSQYSECSPFGRNGVCCNSSNCTWKPRHLNVTCSLESECGRGKFCHKNVGCQLDLGTQPKKFCARNTRICADEVCGSSICSLWNLDEYPSSKVSKENCKLHCYNNQSGLVQVITSLSRIPKIKSIDLNKVFYLLGSSCMNEEEFCDTNGKCVSLRGHNSGNIDLYLIANPEFYKQLSSIITSYTILFILCFFLLCFLTWFLFELPYVYWQKNVYGIFFIDFTSLANYITPSNYRDFKFYVRYKQLKDIFDVRVLIENFNGIKNIREYYNYLLIRQSSFPVRGMAIKMDDEKLMKGLDKLLT